MIGKFVDTNIFVEVFARKGNKSDKCKQLLQSEKNLATSSLVISEIEWVLRYAYKQDKNEIVRYLKKILSTEMEIDNKKLLINALNFYENSNVDWTDCLNMFLVKKAKINQVYSYDKGLNKFDWIKRLEP